MFLLNLTYYIKMLYFIQYTTHIRTRAAIKAPTPLHTTPAPTSNVWLPNFVTAPLTRLVNHTGKDVGLFQVMLGYQGVEFILQMFASGMFQALIERKRLFPKS